MVCCPCPCPGGPARGLGTRWALSARPAPHLVCLLSCEHLRSGFSSVSAGGRRWGPSRGTR